MAQEIKRTCWNCQHERVCILFRQTFELTKTVRVNIDGNAAPGKLDDIPNAIAGCCLQYKVKEYLKESAS